MPVAAHLYCLFFKVEAISLFCSICFLSFFFLLQVGDLLSNPIIRVSVSPSMCVMCTILVDITGERKMPTIVTSKYFPHELFHPLNITREEDLPRLAQSLHFVALTPASFRVWVTFPTHSISCPRQRAFNYDHKPTPQPFPNHHHLGFFLGWSLDLIPYLHSHITHSLPSRSHSSSFLDFILSSVRRMKWEKKGMCWWHEGDWMWNCNNLSVPELINYHFSLYLMKEMIQRGTWRGWIEEGMERWSVRWSETDGLWYDFNNRLFFLLSLNFVIIFHFCCEGRKIRSSSHICNYKVFIARITSAKRKVTKKELTIWTN